MIDNPTIAAKAMDMFVNMRGRTAAKVCQRAVGRCHVKISADGILGPLSFKAINGIKDQEKLLDAMRTEQAHLYVTIVNNNPDQKKFLGGWLVRAYT